MKYFLTKILEEISFARSLRVLKEETSLTRPPFFIIGSGRSGTTILRKQITEKFGANIPPETGGCLPNAIKAYSRLNNFNTEVATTSVLKVFEESTDFAFWNIEYEVLKSYILTAQCSSLQEIIYNIYKCYGEKNGIDSQLWGDKTPWLTYNTKWLKLLFPNAKFIHIYRNPYEVIWSRMTNFHESFDQAFNRWAWAIKAVIQLKKSINQDQIMEIRFENMLEDRKSVLNQIAEFLKSPILQERIIMENSGDLDLPHMKKLRNKELDPSIVSKDSGLNPNQKSAIYRKMILFPDTYHYVF